MRTVTKAMLDRNVAFLLGARIEDVSAITETFLVAARGELVEGSAVRLDGFGTATVHSYKGKVDQLKMVNAGPFTVTSKKKYRVSFKKAPPLTRALRERFGGTEVEKVMEKYGVDEQQKDNEKVASEGCPECGAKAERHGNVLACPKHGTEPFEKNK